jgi:hypothetical protein
MRYSESEHVAVSVTFLPAVVSLSLAAISFLASHLKSFFCKSAQVIFSFDFPDRHSLYITSNSAQFERAYLVLYLRQLYVASPNDSLAMAAANTRNRTGAIRKVCASHCLFCRCDRLLSCRLIAYNRRQIAATQFHVYEVVLCGLV